MPMQPGLTRVQHVLEICVFSKRFTYVGISQVASVRLCRPNFAYSAESPATKEINSNK